MAKKKHGKVVASFDTPPASFDTPAKRATQDAAATQDEKGEEPKVEEEVQPEAELEADLVVGAPSKAPMVWVFIYPADREDKRFMPGDIVEVKEEELMLWLPTLELGRARMAMDREAAEALSKAIDDGTFVLSPEVSQTPHSIQHGGIGRAKEPTEGDLFLQ